MIHIKRLGKCFPSPFYCGGPACLLSGRTDRVRGRISNFTRLWYIVAQINLNAIQGHTRGLNALSDICSMVDTKTRGRSYGMKPGKRGRVRLYTIYL
jgi:hypothetical protein